MKHKDFSLIGPQWPFYNLRVHKISFSMVAKLTLGYLIPGSTLICLY